MGEVACWAVKLYSPPAPMNTLLLMAFGPLFASCTWPLTVTVFAPEKAKALGTVPLRMPPALTVIVGTA